MGTVTFPQEENKLHHFYEVGAGREGSSSLEKWWSTAGCWWQSEACAVLTGGAAAKGEWAQC